MIAIDTIDGERCAIEADRAFLGNEARYNAGGAAISKRVVAPICSSLAIVAMPSTWPGHDMTPQFVTQFQRTFEIEFCTNLPRAKCCARQRLAAGINIKIRAQTITTDFNSSETRPRARNGCAHSQCLLVDKNTQCADA